MADGKLRDIRFTSDVPAGAVVRMKGDTSPFADCIVLGLVPNNTGGFPSKSLKLSRPYAFVSGADTLCPTVLLGSENLTVPFDVLTLRYDVVLTDECVTYQFKT